jgi:3-methyladenine DNA glycosylase Mpg
MNDWNSLLKAPSRTTDTAFETWFSRIAERLLNHSHLVVAARPHRITEVEAYYHSAAHPDPFAHRHPVQRNPGRWYFHRVGQSYRGGTFKGLDLSFGDANSHGGFLIRGLETPDCELVDGPSLCVEHLLKLTRRATVAKLDQSIGERLAWDATSPIRIERSPMEPAAVYRSARIGLTLKKATSDTWHRPFIGRLYRYLTEPRRIGKGRHLLALALAAQGKSADEIQQLTGSPLASIRRWTK